MGGTASVGELVSEEVAVSDLWVGGTAAAMRLRFALASLSLTVLK